MRKLEIIGFNLESCITAQGAGADRIELCANPAEGGTTPSYGLIRAAREILSIELYVMIRPRGGHFVYSAPDFAQMKSDIAICKDLGCDGIVTAVLDPDGQVDRERCCRMVEWAYPMGVTFHRAFDATRDPFEAMVQIVEAGFERILTSGQQRTAIEGVSLIRDLISRAQGSIILMPGAGIRSGNLEKIAMETSALEFHSSARTLSAQQQYYCPDWMHDDFKYEIADQNEVSRMAATLKELEIKVPTVF